MTADQIEKELGWERGVDYPEWGHTDVYLNTISRGILFTRRNPKGCLLESCNNRSKQT